MNARAPVAPPFAAHRAAAAAPPPALPYMPPEYQVEYVDASGQPAVFVNAHGQPAVLVDDEGRVRGAQRRLSYS